MARVIGNIVLFQIGWLACVIGAAQSLPWSGVAIALGIVAWHLWRSPRRRPELMLIVMATVAGMAFDTMLVTSGWLTFAAPIPWPALAPVWIVALWACFATTLNVGLRWLRGRPLVAGALGAAGGPLAYLGGEALGGVSLETTALLALAIGWACLMPLLVRAATHLDGWPAGVSRGGLSAVG